MRVALVLCLIACTSTRQLSNVNDPRLRAPDHHAGFVVGTTDRWKARVDPNTTIRFHGDSGWSDWKSARDLDVDEAGVWVDIHVALQDLADKIEIRDVTPEVASQLETTRPSDAVLEHAGDAWIATAPGPTLERWLGDFELAVARSIPIPSNSWLNPKYAPYRKPGDRDLVGDRAQLYRFRVELGGAMLGTWRLYSARQGWLPGLAGPDVLALMHTGKTTKGGWRWAAIDRIEVANISGVKTLAGIIGFTAVTALLAPVAVMGGGLGHVGNLGAPHGGSSGAPSLGNGGDADAAGTWTPEIAPRTSLDARSMFSTGELLLSMVRPTIALDGAAALHGDLYSTGAVARIRLADVFEIGGGAHVVDTRSPTGWSRSTHGLFQVGLHLPLDAAARIAVPLTFEIGGAADEAGKTPRVYALDMRFLWGLSVSSASGRWFGTLSPATPSYLRLGGDEHGCWSVMSGFELGASF